MKPVFFNKQFLHLACGIIVYLLLCFCAIGMTSTNSVAANPIIQLLFTAIIMLVTIWIIASFSMLRLKTLNYFLIFLFSLAFLFAFVIYIILKHDIIVKMGHFPSFYHSMLLIAIYGGAFRIIINVVQIIMAASLGCVVAAIVKDRGLLLAVSIFAAFTDLWTVFLGPVAKIMKNAPHIAHGVSATIPAVGGGGVFRPAAIIGMGDSLFMGLVFLCVAKFALDRRRNFIWIASLMTLAMLLVVGGVIPFMPALVVLGIAVFIANRKDFNLTKTELASILVTLLIFIAILIMLILRR